MKKLAAVFLLSLLILSSSCKLNFVGPMLEHEKFDTVGEEELSFTGTWREDVLRKESSLQRILDVEAPLVTVEEARQEDLYKFTIQSENTDLEKKLRGKFFDYNGFLFLTVKKSDPWLPGEFPVNTLYKIRMINNDRFEVQGPIFREEAGDTETDKVHPTDWEKFEEITSLSNWDIFLLESRSPLVPDYLDWLLKNEVFSSITAFGRLDEAELKTE